MESARLRGEPSDTTINVSLTAAMYIARSIESKVREPDRRADRIAVHAPLSKRRIDLRLAQDTLGAHDLLRRAAKHTTFTGEVAALRFTGMEALLGTGVQDRIVDSLISIILPGALTGKPRS